MDDLLQANCHLVSKPPTAADALTLANNELHAALADLGKYSRMPGKDGAASPALQGRPPL